MPIIEPSTLTLIKIQHFYSSYYKCEIPLVIYNIDATCMSIVSIYAYTQKIDLTCVQGYPHIITHCSNM